MSTSRSHTLVLDTSVLPKRPKVSEIKNFLETKLKLDMTTVKRIQLHNIKNIVRVGMTSLEEAEKVASCNNARHSFESEGTQVIPVPIYVESSAVDVQVFDLPEDISDGKIKTFFSKYGEVISIREEVWKNFFPGFSNGVKVVKMKLIHPIPSVVTVEGESTLIQYKNQPRPAKPSAAPNTSDKKTLNKEPTNSKLQPPQQQQQQPHVTEADFPALLPKETKPKQQTKLENKRQRSVEDENDEALKKTCTQPNAQSRDADGGSGMATKLKELIEQLDRSGCYDWEKDPKKRARQLLKHARENLGLQQRDSSS